MCVKGFNTSHVTLYRWLYLAFFALCLRFNTSHVTLYLDAMEKSYYNKVSFNTSHVTLYQDTGGKEDGRKEFQYITCYSLSLPPLEGTATHTCFNTSHVTLYRYAKRRYLCKYPVSIHHMLLFILTC